MITAKLEITGGMMVPLAATPMVATAWALASTSTVTCPFTGGHEMFWLTRLNVLSTSKGGSAVVWFTLKLVSASISERGIKISFVGA